jgi:hypothetical protein
VGIRTVAVAWEICTKQPGCRRKALGESLEGLFFVLPTDDDTRCGLGDPIH